MNSAKKCILGAFIMLLCLQCDNNKTSVSSENHTTSSSAFSGLSILIFDHIRTFVDTRTTSCPLINVCFFEKSDSCFIVIYDSPIFRKENYTGYFMYKNIPVVVNISTDFCGQKFIPDKLLIRSFPPKMYAVEDDHPPIPNYENNNVVYILTEEDKIIPSNSLNEDDLIEIIYPDLFLLKQSKDSSFINGTDVRQGTK